MDMVSFLLGRASAGNSESSGSSSGGSSGSSSLEAGVYYNRELPQPPNNYYQQWFKFGGELYLITLTCSGLGNNCEIYKYTDGSWVKTVSAFTSYLSTPGNYCMIEYNGKMHMIGADSVYHLVFDGTTCTMLNNLPQKAYQVCAFIQNGEYKYYSYKTGSIYVWDEESDSWSEEANVASSNTYYYAFTHGDDVFFWYQKNLYKYEDGAITAFATMEGYPMFTNEGCIFGDYFYYITSKTNSGKMRKYNLLTKEDTLLGYQPSYAVKSSMLILDGKLKMIHGSNEGFSCLTVHDTT